MRYLSSISATIASRVYFALDRAQMRDQSRMVGMTILGLQRDRPGLSVKMIPKSGQ